MLALGSMRTSLGKVKLRKGIVLQFGIKHSLKNLQQA